MSKETRYIASSLKMSLNVIIATVVAAALLLLNFFVIDGINAGEVHNLAYWIKKILTALGTFTIMISIANTTEESRKRKDSAYGERLSALDGHYQNLNARALVERMEFYILQKNIKAKYTAFIKKYKKKIARLKDGEKYAELRKAYELKLLLSPQDVWSGAYRVKYAKITYSQLVSGATDVSEKEEENDLNTHRAELVAKKMLWKIIALIGFGMYTPEIIDHFKAFSTADILPLVLRVATILWAVYTGVCFGYLMLDRILVVLKRKLKIFSEFNARTDDPTLVGDAKYLLTYEKDGQIEKIRAKYNDNACVGVRASEQPQAEHKDEQVITEEPKPAQNALQQVFEEIKEEKKPLTPAQLGGRLLKLHLQKQIGEQQAN